MKKVSRENLDALFAAIAEAKKLYLPVADATDERRSAKYAVWTPEAKYSEAVNTILANALQTHFVPLRSL